MEHTPDDSGYSSMKHGLPAAQQAELVDGSAPAQSEHRSRLLRWIAPVLIVIASLAFGVVHVEQHVRVSPIDEYVYIDYLDKVSAEPLVHRGEEVGPYARNELLCRGLRILSPDRDARCDTSAVDVDAGFAMNGVTSADFYTPLYFWATRAMATPAVLLGADLVDAGRGTGWVWLAIAGVLSYLTMRRLRVPPVAAFGLNLLMVGSLSAYIANTYISTDATALAAGSLMTFLGVRLALERRGHVALVIGAALVTMFKVQNLLSVVVVVFALVLLTLHEHLKTTRTLRGSVRPWLTDRRMIAAASAFIVPLVLQVCWLAYVRASAVGPAPDQGVASPLTPVALVGEAVKYLGGPAFSPFSDLYGVQGLLMATLVMWVCLAGVLGLAVVSKAGSIESAFSVAALTVAVLGGPALAVANVITTGIYFDLPPRYGLSLLPVFLLCGALLTRKTRVASVLLGAAGAGSYVLGLLLFETA